jgi:hypothetical protein
MTEKEHTVREAEIAVNEAEKVLEHAKLDAQLGQQQAKAKMERAIAGLNLEVTLAEQQLARERAALVRARSNQERPYDDD